MIPIGFHSEKHRQQRSAEILAAGRKHLEINPLPDTPPYDSYAVMMPGTRYPGGIDSMLAPRTQKQHFTLRTAIEAYQSGWPVNAHRRNERLRQIPLVGGAIANLLHNRLVVDKARRDAEHASARLY